MTVENTLGNDHLAIAIMQLSINGPTAETVRTDCSNSVVVTPTTVALPSQVQKKVRHRRMGSADNNYSYALPAVPNDRLNVKMIHAETQTDTLDSTNMNCSPSPLLSNREFANSLNNTTITDANDSDHSTQSHSEQMKEINLRNGNESYESDSDVKISSDTIDHRLAINDTTTTHSSPKSNEQLIDDYMNSNEQLDICEDDDNLENLNRRVSQFFNENRFLSSVTDNGNSTVDSRRLFNVMAARRSCISINDKDEVLVLNRPGSFRTSTSNNAFSSMVHNESIGRRNNCTHKISDHNCNNDDGDDSWTDEEGEESDRGYSLRRKW